jgi:DNA-binding transcriptional LysR family regulator
VVVARPNHALAAGNAVHAAQLADHDLVSFDPSLPIGRRIRRYLRGHAGEANIVNQFDNIDTIKTFVAETNTVAILPDRTVQREVASGVLVTRPLTPALVRPVGIVYHRQRERGAPARAFIEHLLNHQPTERARRRSDPAAASG